MKALFSLALLLLACGTVRASDKGISEELLSSTMLVCSTTIADDLQPLVLTRHRLMIAKMSQESLAREVASMDAMWLAISRKHQVAIVAQDRFSVTAGLPRQRETVRSDPTIAALPLSARLSSINDQTWLAPLAERGWKRVEEACPAFAKLHGSPQVILEFWLRRLPELQKSPG